MCPRHLKCHYFVKMYNVFLMITFFCPIWPIATLYQYMRTKSRPLQKFRQKRLIFSMNNQTYKRAVVTEVVSVDLLWGILIQRMILNTKTKCRDTLTTIFLRFCAIHRESDIYWLKNDERSKLFQNMPFELFGDSWLKTHKLVWLRVFKVLS